jgi:hypothetical protein
MKCSPQKILSQFPAIHSRNEIVWLSRQGQVHQLRTLKKMNLSLGGRSECTRNEKGERCGKGSSLTQNEAD